MIVMMIIVYGIANIFLLVLELVLDYFHVYAVHLYILIDCCWSNSKKNNKSSKLLDSYKFQYKYNDTFEYTTSNNNPTHNPVLNSSTNKKKHVELKSVNI